MPRMLDSGRHKAALPGRRTRTRLAAETRLQASHTDAQDARGTPHAKVEARDGRVRG